MATVAHWRNGVSKARVGNFRCKKHPDAVWFFWCSWSPATLKKTHGAPAMQAHPIDCCTIPLGLAWASPSSAAGSMGWTCRAKAEQKQKHMAAAGVHDKGDVGWQGAQRQQWLNPGFPSLAASQEVVGEEMGRLRARASERGNGIRPRLPGQKIERKREKKEREREREGEKERETRKRERGKDRKREKERKKKEREKEGKREGTDKKVKKEKGRKEEKGRKGIDKARGGWKEGTERKREGGKRERKREKKERGNERDRKKEGGRRNEWDTEGGREREREKEKKKERERKREREREKEETRKKKEKRERKRKRERKKKDRQRKRDEFVAPRTQWTEKVWEPLP
ncbi:Histone-lysine N-methyltransferase, H3 lysine-79 specific, partial [Ophiophagus hannah]